MTASPLSTTSFDISVRWVRYGKITMKLHQPRWPRQHGVVSIAVRTHPYRMYRLCAPDHAGPDRGLSLYWRCSCNEEVGQKVVGSNPGKGKYFHSKISFNYITLSFHCCTHDFNSCERCIVWLYPFRCERCELRVQLKKDPPGWWQNYQNSLLARQSPGAIASLRHQLPSLELSYQLSSHPKPKPGHDFLKETQMRSTNSNQITNFFCGPTEFKMLRRLPPSSFHKCNHLTKKTWAGLKYFGNCR